MDLNQLAVFVRVIDAGSFTKAAAFLKQPKSRVSRRIAALEKEVGLALLYRTTRHFRPTEAGLALYEQCRDHVYALERAKGSAHDQCREISGTIRVSAAEDMGTAVLGPIVAEMTTRHPRVRIDLVFSNAYVDLVKEGFDLALRIGELSDTTLIARRIGFVSSMLVASPSYLKKADRITRLSDLERHPTLHFSVPHHDDIWSMRGDRKSEERVRVRPLCRASNPRILIDLALAGRGIALAPEFLCFEDLRAGRLKRVLPNYRADVRPVSFVWPKQIELSPKVRELVDIGVKRLSRCFRRQELAQ